jgi:hypothetical protein
MGKAKSQPGACCPELQLTVQTQMANCCTLSFLGGSTAQVMAMLIVKSLPASFLLPVRSPALLLPTCASCAGASMSLPLL